MCGRYTLGRSTREILQRFAVQLSLSDLTERYNIAPSQMVPVVMESGGKRVLDSLKWGLIPFWVKDLRKHKPLINARAESIHEKASFKQALARRRCIIPADGFYEWKGQVPNRRPIYIRRRDKHPFGFAGLWEMWTSPEGEVVRTCAIITVCPNKLMEEIHDRMPAILRPEDEELWLSGAGNDSVRLLGALKPYPDEEIEAFPVSPYVNSAAVDGERCIEPVDAIVTETAETP